MAKFDDNPTKTMVPDLEKQDFEKVNSFLKFQDKNGDKLPDICVVDIIPPEKVCLDCVPNPNAIVTDWRKKTSNFEPYLNEKLCKFEISIMTSLQTTNYERGESESQSTEKLRHIFDAYVEEAITNMLVELSKDTSEDSISRVKQYIDYKDFYLAPHNKSYLKLLYSVDFPIIFNLPDETPEEDEEEDTAEASDIQVSMNTSKMSVNNMKIRKVLGLHYRYLKVYRALEGGNMLFRHSNRIFNLNIYGKLSIMKSDDQVGQVLNDLDGWLLNRGYNIPGVGSWSSIFYGKKVEKLDFIFDSSYKVKQVSVYVEGCSDKPKVYKSNRLRGLLSKPGWRDPTAVAYYVQQDAMARDAEARRPRPWIEFLKAYTYPEVYETIPEGTAANKFDPSSSDAENSTIGSCMKDALANEFKELGDDIMDEVFSLGDAIAKAFHDALCRKSLDEVYDDFYKIGLDPAAINPADPKFLKQMAEMQGYFDVNEKDPIFVSMCKQMLFAAASGTPMQQMDSIYSAGINKLKICGLMDLLLDLLACLLKGLNLEEALQSMIKSALKAMGANDFGDLFIGLPPEKQAQMDALVRQKLSEGIVHDPDLSTGDAAQAAANQRRSSSQQGVNSPKSTPFLGKMKVQKPWEDKKFVEYQEKQSRTGNYGNSVPTRSPSHGYDGGSSERRTLGQQLSGPSPLQSGLDPNKIMEAYMLALLEVYQDNLLELLDELNKFPGAQFIAKLISILDCPSPPLFNPSIMDFIKSIELPFCRTQQDLVLPRLENPFAHIPKLSDILYIIFLILKNELIKLVIKIILMIFAKICEIIGDAICKALEIVGNLAAAAITGTNAMDLIRETICGPDADDNKVKATMTDMVASLGVGGAALADPETAQSFFADAINTMTRNEAIDALLNGPTDEVAARTWNLVNYEYPEYLEAFPNPTSIKAFMKNCGNLISAGTKNTLKDSLLVYADELDLPANPSICASPEEQDLFDKNRCALLEGRMSPADCDAQNQKLKEQLLENLDQVGNLLHAGIGPIVEANMPPIFSDPECDNGLLPFEPEPAKQVATMGLKGDIDKLHMAYVQDMLNEGNLFTGKKSVGFINMVLSDTLGNPYTVHQRKANNNDFYVDFTTNNLSSLTSDQKETIGIGDSSPFPASVVEVLQKGAYPYYVGDWLRAQMKGINGAHDLMGSVGGSAETESDGISFFSSNIPSARSVRTKSFKDLGFVGFFGTTNVDLTAVPDHGYNVLRAVDYVNDRVTFTRLSRKNSPDTILRFKDNAKGYRSEGKEKYSYGFDIEAYYGDIIENPDKEAGGYFNQPNDNCRVKIIDKINLFSNPAKALEELSDGAAPDDDGSGILAYRRFEFMGIDSTLDEIDLQEFPNLFKAFSQQTSFAPQVFALYDLFKGDLAEAPFSIEECKEVYDTVNHSILKRTIEYVGNNEAGWLFGAAPDTLTRDDFEYGIKLTEDDAGINGGSPGDFIQYSKYRIRKAEGGTRIVENDDGILGISFNQWQTERDGTHPDKTRVFYLNPSKFGAAYVMPTFYVKPNTDGAGWLALVNAMFPEYSPCKPRKQQLVNFEDIQSMIDQSYPRIPEDKRLKDDPDCVLEVPFNRILGRPAKAGIQALIMSMIRIFSSVHFLKAIATFSSIYPKFPDNYGNLFAAYITERMEESCKEGGNDWFYGPFKDEEFWYAFLEQSVQLYSRRLDDPNDEVFTPDNCPLHVQNAIQKINDLQENYDYADRKDFKDAPLEDKGLFETLKGYRQEKNLEAVAQVEEHAKLILHELVTEQLVVMGETFISNLKENGFDKPVVTTDDIFFSEYIINHSLKITSDSTYIETPLPGTSLGTGYNLYSTGEALCLPDGTPYAGPYHTHTDENGELSYMVGEEHKADIEHDILRPFAELLSVGILNISLSPTWTVTSPKEEPKYVSEIIGIGDVGTTVPAGDVFYVRKKILINGSERSSYTSAVNNVRSAKGLISDSFRHTLRHTYNKAGEITGISGNIGVQYALEFGLRGQALGEVVVDALDLPCSTFAGIPENSKILLCLVENLKKDTKFRMVVDYIFSMRKANSLVAIYNDMGLLPSIGEYTVNKGDLRSPGNKPGMAIDLGTLVPGEGGRISIASADISAIKGWAHEKDRRPGFLSDLLYLDYDEWDQKTLKKSVKRVKRLFRPYYRFRRFSVEDSLAAGGPSPAQMQLDTLMETFRPMPGIPLPSWMRMFQRDNPFDSKGQMCKKPD
jgi:hypothetical protein